MDFNSALAINKAIEACANEGGGTVVVPAGTFFTGPIELKSNVNLHVSEGAILRFSTNPKDYTPFVLTRWEGIDCYNYKPLIYAYNQKNIAISGKGTLDGMANEQNWWPWKGRPEYGWKEGMSSQEHNSEGKNKLVMMESNRTPIAQRIMKETDLLRPQFINIYRCERVLIEGVKITNSPFWLIHPLMCNNLIVRGITAESNGPNNDGCDRSASSATCSTTPPAACTGAGYIPDGRGQRASEPLRCAWPQPGGAARGCDVARPWAASLLICEVDNC